jgi:hypothetical protein
MDDHHRRPKECGLHFYVCAEGHVHLEIMHNGEEVSSITIPIEDWLMISADVAIDITKFVEEHGPLMGPAEGHA